MYLRVVCLVDWHLEVFYCPYYKIKNARMHELNFMHPNIYYRTAKKQAKEIFCLFFLIPFVLTLLLQYFLHDQKYALDK